MRSDAGSPHIQRSDIHRAAISPKLCRFKEEKSVEDWKLHRTASCFSEAIDLFNLSHSESQANTNDDGLDQIKFVTRKVP